MADPMAGWAKVGDLLGGDSELEYQKGLQLGANTENALAQASERRTKAKAQLELAEQLKAANVDAARADAAVGALVSGGGLKDVGDMLSQQQEYGFRDDAANPDIPFATGNRRLMGVASAPVERFAGAGEGMLQDKFSNEEPTVTPIGEATIKQKEASATRAAVGSQPKVYLVGGVPYMVGPDGELQRKLSPEEVAANVGLIANERDRGKGAAKAEGNLPAAFSKYRNTTDNANQVMTKIDDALKDVSWVSAGPLAGGSSGVPGTPAFKLAQAVLSIKANVGFQELSKMRHESPTGGALGNVTEKELEFLQGAIASMNTAQNPADLAKSLADVRDSYARYRDYAAQDYEIAQERSQYAPKTPAPAGAQSAPGNQPTEPSNTAGETRMLGGKKYVKVGDQWFEDDGT